MKKFISIVLVIVLLFGTLIVYANDEEERLTALLEEIEYCNKQLENYHLIAELMREMGYADSHRIIKFCKKEYQEAKQYKLLCIEEYNRLIWQKRYREYPIASAVWELLKENNFSDAACAGILGNFMTECGHQSFDLEPYTYSPDNSYYGLAQWSTRFYPQVMNKDINEQIEFLMSNIESQFDTYGSNYYNGFNYSIFISLTDEQECAIAFAKCYERCSSASYGRRKQNATNALEYFSDDIF